MRSNSVLKAVPCNRRDPATWPDIDTTNFDDAEQARIIKEKLAVTDLLKGASSRSISECYAIHPLKLRRILKRCLSTHPDGDIYGFRALIRWLHPGLYRRRSEISRGVMSGRGHCSGALTKLLSEHPAMLQRLKDLISSGKQQTEARSQFSVIYGEFIRIARELGLDAKGMWPFNTKSLGFSAIRLLVNSMQKEKPSELLASIHGGDARVRSNTGRGYESLLTPPVMMACVGIDELAFDGITTLAIQTPGGGEQDIPIERLAIAVAVEKISGRILGWHAYFSTSVSALDMRCVIQNALNPARSGITLELPLSYPEATVEVPDRTFQPLEYAGWTTLWLDNTFGHQSLTLTADIGRVLGSLINFGPVGQWYRRSFLERKIKDILFNCAHKLPSTTGSSPTDTLKSSDPAGQAVKYKIRWHDVRQVVDVAIAGINATPSEAIGYLSPDELAQQWIADPAKGFLRRPLPKARCEPASLVRQTERKRISGNFKLGRRPHIVIDRVRYGSPELAKNWGLIGKELLVGIDERDMRTVTASVADNGIQLGVLVAQGGWSRVPHSRAMRKEINQLIRLRRIFIATHEDPVSVYLRYNLNRATDGAKSRKPSEQKKSTKAATKIAAAKEATGHTFNEILSEEPAQTDKQALRVTKPRPGNLLSQLLDGGLNER